MAYGFNLQPMPFGFPAVSPWPQGFQPMPPAPVAPQPQQEAAGGLGLGGGAPGGAPLFPNLAARFPRLAQAGQAIRGFAEGFDERFPRIGEWRGNNRDMLSNVGMALLTTRPGDNAPVREAFYMGRQSDQQRAAQTRAEAQEQARRDSLRQLITGGAPGAPGGVPAPTTGPGRNDGSWMRAGSGATGTNAPPVIEYANEGSIRNDPISGDLQNALQAAAASVGIDRIVVHSGGQEAAGEGGARTGSTRHDHGNAADVELYVGGRLLDFSNPQDQAIYQQFVTAAVANGVTGIGAGADYMGNARIHVGFGAPAVWGAGGSGETAPDWLRTAYSGAGGGQAAPAAQGGINGLSPEQQQFALALLEINPAAAEQFVMQAMLARQEQRPLMNLDAGDTVWDPNTRQPVFTAPEQADAATQLRPMNAEERAAWGIPEGDPRIWAFDPTTNEPSVIGGNATPGMTLEMGADGTVRFTQGNAVPNRPTEGQANANIYASRMEAADPLIEQFAAAGTNLGQHVAAGLGIVGNFITSPERQQFDQAARDFINASLRRESGAVISEEEFANARQQYLPMPGDSPEVLAQKAENRRRQIEGIRAASGPFAGTGAGAPTPAPADGAPPAGVYDYVPGVGLVPAAP